MHATLGELADLVHGTVQGDADLLIQAARTLGEARLGDITFLEHEQHLEKLHQSRASAAVVPMTVPANGKAVIQVQDPLFAFAAIVRHMHKPPAEAVHGIDPKASVHPSAKIGPDASIHPFAVVGEGAVIGARCKLHSGAVVGRFCTLGDDVVLHPNVVLYEGVQVGHRVTIHANSVIGADGFGYRTQQGRHVKVPQLGTVEIADDVEIGACSTIDRGTFGNTRIGEGTKIDNLVQIAHNCQIGKHNLFVAQVGIAGSTGTGDYVVLAGQAGVADHLYIGAGTVVGAKTGVTKNVPNGQRVLGNPARPERDQKRMLVTLDRLPEMRKDLRRIKQHLGLADNDTE